MSSYHILNNLKFIKPPAPYGAEGVANYSLSPPSH